MWADRGGQREYQLSPEAEVANIFLTDSGDVVIDGNSANAPPPYERRIWKWTPQSTAQLAGPIWPAVDPNGAQIADLFESSISTQAVSANGQVFFHGYGKSSSAQYGNLEGVWTTNGLPSDTRQVFKWGEPIAANTPGVMIASASNMSPLRVNATGTFVAGIETTDANNAEYDALITNRSGDLKALYRGGDQVPGQPDATFTGGFLNNLAGGPDINGAGDIAFFAGTERQPSQPGDAIQYGGGIFVDRNGILSSAASVGQSIAGGGARSIFGFSGGFAINQRGSVAFEAYINPDPGFFDANAIVVEDTSGQLKSVVAAGDSVPGGPAGARFLVRSFTSYFAFNGLGQIAFTGQFVPVGGSASNPMLGVFVYDPTRGLLPVALPGDIIEVQPGDLRKIAVAGIIGFPTGGEDGTAKMLNENGELLFFARFTDGSNGLFVSNLVAVPEPAGVILAVAGALCMFWFKSTRRHNLCGDGRERLSGWQAKRKLSS